MYGEFAAVKDVSLSFASNQVHALIGPSGCGKSTFPAHAQPDARDHSGAWIEGKVVLDGETSIDRASHRCGCGRRVGMVFQKPRHFRS
jgi:phosphate transport system ATP-binding protein